MASSSTSSLDKSYQYDVFLSFRGEDVRKTFIDHLYAALQRQGIYAYKDDERLNKGKRIKDELMKSIEDSRYYIIIFSKNYASSSWCLDELVKIIECQKMNEQTAYPVFYDVDPSEVRKQHGPVGEALAKHATKEAWKWKEALEEAGNLSGWDLRNTADGHEHKVIQRIVECMSLELRSVHLHSDENLIGLESRIKDVEPSLGTGINDVRMIGIKGMGGGGKTTLARAIFDKICIQFEGISFIENVREVSQKSGLRSLQSQLLSDVLKDDITVNSVHDGKAMMKMRLHGIKVLVVLDDVDHMNQLEALAGVPNWLKPGSRIIITTRDEQLLVAHRVDWIHTVSLLTNEEAICLFSRYTFGTNFPSQGYEKLTSSVVNYAAGLPLTIKVLGSFLCGKDELEWNDALKRLKSIPDKETLEKLEISYTGLEDDYKEIFLDVACFLKGTSKDYAIRMLESCGFHARNGLRVLEQKSLITIVKRNFLNMHDHIQEMGKNIVRRLNPYEPHKHSRLWIKVEITDILTNDLGTETTRCLSAYRLPLNLKVAIDGLRNMVNLRYLRLNCKESKGRISGDLKIDRIFQHLPSSLRCLTLDHYPHRCLPKSFEPNNLVALIMPFSKIEQLWEGGERKVLKNLRFLDLKFSNLETFDLGLAPNLEDVDLSRCHLEELHAPVGCLKRLVSLNLNMNVNFSSFSFMNESNNTLLKLDISNNDMEEVPSSIGNLHKLVSLEITSCENLRSLPRSICELRHLRELNLSHSGIKVLPQDLGDLERLELLNLSFSRIKYLPNSICKLIQLKTLDLSHCELLKLPEDLGELKSLKELDLTCCKIIDIPISICKLKHLRKLCLIGCYKIEKLPENIGELKNLELLGNDLDLFYPPEMFSLMEGLNIIGLEPYDESTDTSASSTPTNDTCAQTASALEQAPKKSMLYRLLRMIIRSLKCQRRPFEKNR